MGGAEQTHRGLSGVGGVGEGGCAGVARQTFDMHHWYAINISGRV